MGWTLTFVFNNNAESDFAKIGITITQTQIKLLEKIAGNLNTGQITAAKTDIETLDAQIRDISTPEAETLFKLTFDRAQNEVKDAFIRHINDIGGQALYDKMAGTTEMIALVDMAFNGGSGIIGRQLSTALFQGNRAAAWYEIRYKSNGGDSQSPGIANRRYRESDLFGLYNDINNVSETDARDVLRVIMPHFQDIVNYEQTYSTLASGTAIIMQQITPARDMLIGRYAAGATIDGQVLVGYDQPDAAHGIHDILQGTSAADLLLGGAGNDRLEGNNGNDVLLGEAGDDVLIGGAGADILNGGDGNDIYIITGTDGLLDRIIDSDRKGTIIFQNTNGTVTDTVAMGGFIADPSRPNTWVSPDGQITITHNSPWTLTTTNGASVSLGDDFVDGDFGITLSAAPAPSSREIVGDYAPIEYTGSYDGNPQYHYVRTDTINGAAVKVYYKYNDLGNYVVSGTMQSRADLLYGSGGNDLIEGKTLSDLLWGGAGDDRLYAGNRNDLSQAQDPTIVGTTMKGDLLSGGAGRDTLVGSSDMDVIFGGAGQDLIFAGAGADFVDGDADWKPYDSTTDFSITLSNGYISSVRYGPMTGTGRPVDGAADTIYGGGGNDWINGGLGDDVLIGEDGNDFILGEEGNDLLSGGAGNDELQGGNDNDTLLGGDYSDRLFGDSGNDLLGGGTGGDELHGGDGNDTLLGEDGGDLMFGELGDDVLDGGVGVDDLQGGDGNDAILGGSESDLIHGDAGDDVVDGQGGNDQVQGNDGNDIVLGGDGADLLFGQLGDDLLDGGADADELQGGEGQDTLFGGDGGDRLFGQSGHDQIYGGVGIDNISGGDGNDVLDGGEDDDALLGEAGDDQLYGGDGVDFLDGGDGQDTLIGDSGNDRLQGGAGNDQLYGEADSDRINGDDGQDLLMGGAGVDQLEGGAGDDQLYGGTESDNLFGGDGDDLIFGEEDNDFLSGGGNVDLLDGGVGNDLLYGDAGNDLLVGGQGADDLYGGDDDDDLDGGEGDDLLYGGAGNDVYRLHMDGSLDVISDSGGSNKVHFDASVNPQDMLLTGAVDSLGNSYLAVFYGNAEILIHNGFNVATGIQAYQFADGTSISHSDLMQTAFSGQVFYTGDAITASADVVYGGNRQDILDGGAGDDSLYGAGGNDFLYGGSGVDLLVGGLGDDTYTIDNIADLIMENADEGTDYVQSSVNYALSDTLEHLTLSGTASVNGTGNSLSNMLTGNAANNILTGGDGNDLLDGGVGADTLIGGLGNDTYVVDDAADIVTEQANQGVDTIKASQSYTLGDNIENLFLTGTGSVNAGGNAVDNVIIGNDAANTLTGGAGNDFLDGGIGSDKLVGGTGNDFYVLDSTRDTVVEATNEGIDTVQVSLTYTLGNNIENLFLTGTGAINGTGNALNNILTGNGAGNTLSGGVGADNMAGSAGNDVYIVDNIGDVVVELTGEGVDLVQSSVTYALVAQVENLTLMGTATINGSGNDLDNVLTGNRASNILSGDWGNDTLNGAGGADILIGGLGDDIYVADVGTDTIIEALNEGVDTVQSGVSYTLSANVENLTLTGTNRASGSGNTLDNVLIGNAVNNTLKGDAGNDILDGGVGSDTLIGGLGDDSYVVNVTTDVVTELVGEGIDTVQSGVSYTLGANLENLILTGTTALNGSGNILDNTMIGNAAANVLDGAAGADILLGGAGDDILGGVYNGVDYNSIGNDYTGGTGNDTLRGTLGADTYRFGRGDGQDLIQENAPSSQSDQIILGADITRDQLWFSQSGNDLLVNVIGTSDQVTIQNWYLGSNYHVEQIRTADGLLLDSQVEQLRSAMAAFSPPPSGQLTLSAEQHLALDPVIAASWQNA